MADLKISALPAATTPLAGTEVLPIVQSGATDKVTVSNLTAGRSVSVADLIVSTGNIIPSTAAKGVNFTANTPAASMTSQLLNWYEEGTWTPDASSWDTAPSINAARYTRIGRQVTATILGSNGVISTTGKLISGLPFTSGSTGGTAIIKDVSGGLNYSIGSIGDASTSIGSLTLVTLTGNFWSLSATYFV